MRKPCYGCKYLGSEPDGAGGGTYKCMKNPGMVVGEWGHWTSPIYDDPTHPAEWDCWKE